MDQQLPQRLRLHELTPDIHYLSPIWYLWDDEEWLYPVDDVMSIDEEKYPYIFVLAELMLRDSTRMKGIIYINAYRRREPKFVYGITFIRDRETVHFAGKSTDLLHLQEWLSKTINEISPVTWSTPYYWNDSTPVGGVVDLVD